MGGCGVNYYPFHLGDYAAHTAHLEPLEDLAYRRMLDLYYRTEKALPSDWREVGRLIRLRDQAAVIESVLAEFFTLSDDGWHSKRADAELTAMLTKQEQQASKDEHEAERMRRHRERRAELFAALRAAGVVPAWDTPMKELQRLHETTCNGTATGLQREQAITANAPATAIPTPTPTPTPTPETKTARKRAAPAVLVSLPELVADGVEEQHATDWLVSRKSKGLPLTPTAWADVKAEAIKARMTPGEAVKAAACNGWGGFKAAWMQEPARNGPHLTAFDRKAAEAAKWMNPTTPIPGRDYVDMEMTDAAPIALR
jgi:uncharacterized protein YdaU (DUF1376 family)